MVLTMRNKSYIPVVAEKRCGSRTGTRKDNNIVAKKAKKDSVTARAFALMDKDMVVTDRASGDIQCFGSCSRRRLMLRKHWTSASKKIVPIGPKHNMSMQGGPMPTLCTSNRYDANTKAIKDL